MVGYKLIRFFLFCMLQLSTWEKWRHTFANRLRCKNWAGEVLMEGLCHVMALWEEANPQEVRSRTKRPSHYACVTCVGTWRCRIRSDGRLSFILLIPRVCVYWDVQMSISHNSGTLFRSSRILNGLLQEIKMYTAYGLQFVNKDLVQTCTRPCLRVKVWKMIV